jgi:hypothetical protein
MLPHRHLVHLANLLGGGLRELLKLPVGIERLDDAADDGTKLDSTSQLDGLPTWLSPHRGVIFLARTRCGTASDLPATPRAGGKACGIR